MQRYETFCSEYEKVALQIAPALGGSGPSRAQYYRWLSGQLRGGVPYPDACRVLEEMFPPWTAAELFAPDMPELSPVIDTPAVQTDDRLLAPVPHSFSAQALEGVWVTCYQFGQAVRPKVHVDIARLVAKSDRSINIKNHPPQPRSEGRKVPFLNEIEAELASRHLIGHWKNTSDTRYFGSLHLAVLPGETVMEGYYTAFSSDIQVVAGRWKWVRIDLPTPSINLTEVKLREPAELHALMEEHTPHGPPLSVEHVREDD